MVEKVTMNLRQEKVRHLGHAKGHCLLPPFSDACTNKRGEKIFLNNILLLFFEGHRRIADEDYEEPGHEQGSGGVE